MTPMRSLLLAAAACLGLGIAEAAAQVAPQLDTIRQRNVFRCGVYENVPGLSARRSGRRQPMCCDAAVVTPSFSNSARSFSTSGFPVVSSFSP